MGLRNLPGALRGAPGASSDPLYPCAMIGGDRAPRRAGADRAKPPPASGAEIKLLEIQRLNHHIYMILTALFVANQEGYYLIP